MDTYVILSKINPGTFTNSADFKKAARAVSDTIAKECPGIVMKESYALLGDYDVVDIVQSDSKAELMKAVEIIRSKGKASTQTFSAIPWKEHLDNL
ncbi:MAG: GYD domain-containing protein [candidate division Zixibacteria bacterium]|nr:GYD domain-containing protein [candidate division Zixibacteria bacterium]